MRNLLFIAALLFSTISCSNKVSFEQPQPEVGKNLESIPDILIGNYISEDGSSKMLIDQSGIYCTYEYEVACKKDSSMNKEFSNPPIRIDGDSNVYLVNFTDTIFWMSDEFLLKKAKGYYFINQKKDDNSWIVKTLNLNKGMLTISSINTKEELEKLKEINDSSIDSKLYNISFKRKQFKRFVDNDRFTKIEKFIKVKPEE
jgi:hypothetical protein